LSGIYRCLRSHSMSSSLLVLSSVAVVSCIWVWCPAYTLAVRNAGDLNILAPRMSSIEPLRYIIHIAVLECAFLAYLPKFMSLQTAKNQILASCTVGDLNGSVQRLKGFIRTNSSELCIP